MRHHSIVSAMFFNSPTFTPCAYIAGGPNLNESQGCWNIGSKLDLPIYQLIAHCDPKISVKLADSFGSDKCSVLKSVNVNHQKICHNMSQGLVEVYCTPLEKHV